MQKQNEVDILEMMWRFWVILSPENTYKTEKEA